MGPVLAISNRLGVQPAERGLFAWAGLCLLLMGAAAFALMNTAETLFLKRVGVEALPLALLASSGLLVVTTAWIGRITSADPARWLPRVLFGLALSPLPFIFLAGSRNPIIFGAMVLVARQVLAVGLLAFWVAMGNLVPARRAKQLFAPLASGVTVGGILGSFGSGPLAGWLGVSGLIGLCCVLLAGSAVTGMRLRRSGTRALEREIGATASKPRSSPVDTTGFWELLRSNRLFRLMGVALLCGGALSPVLYFEFTSVLDAATQGADGEARLLGLYSQFRGWLNVATLAAQLWLSSMLYRRIGLPLSMALWPAAYVLGFGWLGVDFALVAAFASFGAARLTEDGISDSAARVLYNLFPDSLRARASGLLEGPVNRLGGVLGNGFVLGAIALGWATGVGWVALPVALVWLLIALVLWRAYPGLLLRASAEHGLAGAGIDRATLIDPATLRSLRKNLLDPDPRVCRAALDLVVDGESSRVVRLLAETIEEAPPANRPLLVEALHRLVEPLPPGESSSREAIQSLARTLGLKPLLLPEERADVVRIFARLSSGPATPASTARDSLALLSRALGDPAAPVRLAALAELHRRGAPPPGLPDLDRSLAAALGASDAFLRRAARKELRAILMVSAPDAEWSSRLDLLVGHLDQRADRAETMESLREVARRQGDATQAAAQEALRYADDGDPGVRGALLGLAGHAGLAEEAPRLVSALGAREPAEAQGAREGLVALGVEAALPLLLGLELGGVARREAVVSVLRELEVDPDTLDSLRVRQLEMVRQVAVARAAVDDLPSGLPSLLRRRLDERVTEGLGALLDLLAAIHGDSRLAALERRMRRAVGGRESDLLIEAVEALLRGEERQAILAFLESRDCRTRGEAAARALGREIPAREAALVELRESVDPTTRELARAISLDDEQAIGDARAMPSAMDIAVHLRDVPAFDRLSTPQLMALAGLLQEQKLAPGERIFAEGEEALGLYFVMEGEVELCRGPVVFERFGVGRYFGELSTLDGVPRSADAVARVETRLLRLERDDLFSLLEESPGLAVGLAQSLASRMRRLEDRLAEAVSPLGEVGVEVAPSEEAREEPS